MLFHQQNTNKFLKSIQCSVLFSRFEAFNELESQHQTFAKEIAVTL